MLRDSVLSNLIGTVRDSWLIGRRAKVTSTATVPRDYVLPDKSGTFAMLSDVGGGGGATDHGALTGLADDDHAQYHNNARGDARYSLLAHSHSGTYDVAGAAAAAQAAAIAASAPAAHVGAGGAAHATAIAAGAAGFMTGGDKTKLDGVATGATANAADATLLARANHTGTQLAATISDFSAAVAPLVPNASYRVILDSTGSHIAARTANTYGLAQGQPAAITGVGTLYALNVIYIDSADYPTVAGLAAKLRVRAALAVNDVAPTGNYTFGLHPVTRPATSGGAGLVIYTIGAAVSGSTVTVTAPAADSHTNAASAAFALPANGFYVLGFVSTATVAASSHLHISMALQLRNN